MDRIAGQVVAKHNDVGEPGSGCNDVAHEPDQRSTADFSCSACLANRRYLHLGLWSYRKNCVGSTKSFSRDRHYFPCCRVYADAVFRLLRLPKDAGR